MNREAVDVVIVGGGPVGLFLACALSQQEVSCVVLEKRRVPAPFSRAIGLHPPTLEQFDAIGIGDTVRETGVCIRRGHLYYGAEQLGTLTFAGIHGKYPFALSLPQSETERILTDRLNRLAPNALQRGKTVIRLSTSKDGVCVETDGKKAIEAAFVVGCDGKNSFVRERMGISFPGRPYPDTYLMGDFADDTEFGTDAALYLTEKGIIESFPLPRRKRRWVAYIADTPPEQSAAFLSQQIQRRIGRPLPVDTCSWVSSFGIQGYCAEHFAWERVFLAGDAAHIVSPMGGQGMNLGFLDAADLSQRLPGLLRSKVTTGDIMAEGLRYTDRRKQVVRIALKRAVFNTVMGRPMPPYSPRLGFARMAVKVPTLLRYFARIFTMRDLGV